MKAIARLVLTYFTGTLLARWLTAICAPLVIACLSALAWMSAFPEHSSAAEGPHRIALLASYAVLFIIAVAVGLCGLFLATTLMPATLGKYALGRQMSILPHGRDKLLLSGFVTILLLSLPVAIMLPLLMSIVVPSIDAVSLFARTYAISCINLTLLYTAYWFASTRDTAGGRLAGAMIIVAIILGPSGVKYLNDPSARIFWPLVLLSLGWLVLVVGYLRLSDIRAFIAKMRPRFAEDGSDVHDGTEQRLQIDLFLGTARPWPLALIQIVPAIVATQFVRSPQVWLFYLTIFSAVSGAIACTAATRARALWLRTDWSRAELFTQVERRFWRHNAYALSVLLLLLVLAGTYLELPIRLLALGLPLLVLGATATTYLGLLMTRPLRWMEIGFAVVTMGLLMATALLAVAPDVHAAWLVALEVALTVVAVAFRAQARRRWQRLDWMQCSPRTRSLRPLA